MQNARRAGATRIDVVRTDEYVSFKDNGVGISAFADLLTLAGSNWDATIMESDAPYGMGFFSALFAADRVVVKSRGQQIDIKCDDFLEQVIPITKSNVDEGTVVTLYGGKVIEMEIYDNLARYCKGFSVPVYYTGKTDIAYSAPCDSHLFESPSKLDNSFVPFEHGHIRLDFESLKNRNDGQKIYFDAFLQGFEVHKDSNRYAQEIIIHLNSSFKARMPDRDVLINEADELKRIRQGVYDVLKQKLIELKQQDPIKIFEYRSIAETLGYLDIFNDIEVIPPSYFLVMGEPQKNDYFRNGYMSYLASSNEPSLTRSFFENRLIVSRTGYEENNETSGYAMALLMALFHKEALQLGVTLHHDHWIHTFIKELPDLCGDEEDSQEVVVSYNPIKTGTWEGMAVHIVDSYNIKVPSLGLDVTVNSRDGLALGCDEYGSVSLNELLIPPDADADVLSQIRTWVWDDSYHEEAEEEDKASLNAIIDLLRGDNECTVLKTMLERSDWAIRNAMKGKSFKVMFFENGVVEVSSAD